MIKKTMSILLVAFVLVALVAPLPTIAAPPNGGGLTVPVTGTSAAGPVSGTFAIQKFINTGDATKPVGAVGTLILQTPNGLAITQVTMPVPFGSTTGNAVTPQAVTVTCEILDLTLGPLDLTLLGLVIHLDQVHLTIDANPFGGLLGQLLCAIANLLGPGGIIIGSVNQLIAFLNQLLALLGGLGL